jgi:hypothetical protein
MDSLESALERAEALDPDSLADSVQAIGFDCTRCGKCCSGQPGDPHTATIFPDEVRDLETATGEPWDAVARPIPFGLDEGRGETFEWALQTDECGDCRFLVQHGDGTACGAYRTRPLICQTYPFSVDLAAFGPDDESAAGFAGVDHQEAVVERNGAVRAHECPGLGREIERERALELARVLRERTIRELEEAIAVREHYDPAVGDGEPVVVHDSEGAKRPDGTPIRGRTSSAQSADGGE